MNGKKSLETKYENQRSIYLLMDVQVLFVQLSQLLQEKSRCVSARSKNTHCDQRYCLKSLFLIITLSRIYALKLLCSSSSVGLEYQFQVDRQNSMLMYNFPFVI